MTRQEYWTLYFDGFLMATDMGAWVVIISPKGDHTEYAIRLHFRATNNMAEYKALLHGLKIASELGVRRLFVKGDSELVISQVIKEASCHDDKMAAYYKEVWKLEERFNGHELHHVLRRDKLATDSLAKLAASQKPTPLGVFTNDAHEPTMPIIQPQDPTAGAANKDNPAGEDKSESILPAQPRQKPETANQPDLLATNREVTSTSSDWTRPYIEYMLRGTLLDEVMEARRLAKRYKSFMIIGDTLYKRSTIGILQECILQEQGE